MFVFGYGFGDSVAPTWNLPIINMHGARVKPLIGQDNLVCAVPGLLVRGTVCFDEAAPTSELTRECCK